MIIVTLALIALTLSVGVLDKRVWSALEGIVPLYLATLMVAFMMRGLADYNSLLLNGAYRERDVLRSGKRSRWLSPFPLSVVTTPMFGLPGLLFTTLLGTTLYALLSGYARSRDSCTAGIRRP